MENRIDLDILKWRSSVPEGNIGVVDFPLSDLATCKTFTVKVDKFMDWIHGFAFSLSEVIQWAENNEMSCYISEPNDKVRFVYEN